MQIAVGGCLAQKDRGRIVEKAPWVDVVFGTHNLASLPVLLERARHNADAQVEIVEALQNFPSDLPTRRESPYSAWVSISVGCDNTCTFCIVPRLRGIETDRPPDDVLREIRALVQSGVVEITLLGQNVNSYGRSFGDRFAFGKLLRACGEIDGLDRVRFTSPHPRDFTDDVIDAMAQTPNVCPQLHMPMQSGSDVILKAMRRSYRQARYLDIIARVRSAIPGAAITTDIIVGFPGETEQDFEQTLHVVREARFAGAFTFQYSKRPGTAAAEMDGQVPKAVVQERYDRLIAEQEAISWAESRELVGREVEVLVSAGEGRKDVATGRVSGRARDGRLVHVCTHGAQIAPGDLLTATITHAAPHHLLADGGITTYRRWPGERHAARRAGGADAARPAGAADAARPAGATGSGLTVLSRGSARDVRPPRPRLWQCGPGRRWPGLVAACPRLRSAAHEAWARNGFDAALARRHCASTASRTRCSAARIRSSVRRTASRGICPISS